MTYETSDWSVALLRFGLGIVFLVHGIGKLFGVGPAAADLAGFAGMLSGMNVPAATFFAYVVAIVEGLGGLLVLLGLFTRYASALIAVDMLTATVLVHLPNGFAVSNGGYEFVLVLFLMATSLVLSGAGALSLELALFDEEFGLPVDPSGIVD